MKRLFMSIVSLIAIAVAGVSCLQLEQPVLVENLSGDEIVFGADAHIEAQTKASSGTTETTSLTSFYVSAVTGSAGSESSAFNSTQFSQVQGSNPATYKGSKMWPSSDQSYKFYASNVPLTFAAAGTTVSATNTTDVVCAYLTNGTYKTKNTLTFEHIFARFGRVDVVAESGYTISNISIRITPKTGGTYNLRTGAGKTDGTGWSSVTTGSATVVANATGANANDIYLVPGTYEVKVTWTATQGGTSITYTDKVVSVPIVGGKTNVVSLVLGGEILFGVDLEEYCEYNYRDNLNYLNFYCDEAGTIGWKCTNASVAKTIQYSKDQGATWTSITSTTSGVTVSVSAGDIVWFKGTNSVYATSSYNNYFTTSNKVHVYGNVNSLTGNNDSVADYCFRYLFKDCSNIYSYDVKKIILPATSLGIYCYQYMFQGCTNMTTAPDLPATTLGTYCYSYMFYNCSALLNAPDLPALTLREQCYSNMFNGCTSLTSASKMSATTLAQSCCYNMYNGCTALVFVPDLLGSANAYYCYNQMFQGCSSLRKAPDLPSLSVGYYSYASMFKNCTSLVSAPDLPATTLMSYSYSSMFDGCSSLVKAPEISATSLGSYCYQYMFRGCTSLKKAPELPATTLGTGCYKYMFYNCSSLVEAPVLPATTLESGCYEYMFYGCSSLNYIKALFITTPSTTYTNSWVSGVAASGTFVKNTAASWDVTGTNGVPTGWTVNVEDDSRDNLNYLTFFCDEAGEIQWRCSNASVAKTIQYSKDQGATWTSITSKTSGAGVTVSAGDIVWFKGSNSSYGTSSDYNFFSLTRNAHVYGNVNSLTGDNTSVGEYCFNSLFVGGGSKLYTYADKKIILPATTLANYCYKDMFKGCISLETAPELPATTLAEYCYYMMFQGCISLTTAPELPASTLANYCYNSMFEGCTSLETAPELPATTLANYCYNRMFRDCTSLTIAPELPATTLVESCYRSMFEGCTSLEIAPELPATTLASCCYFNMFYSCTSLEIAPELPATTLVESCYRSMFEGCTSLETAPELPATTLVNYCYRSMFEGCSSLNYIKALFTSTPGYYYTYNWVSGVAATGTFVKNLAASWNVTGTDGIPTGWTVKSEAAPIGRFTVNANGNQVGFAPGNLQCTVLSALAVDSYVYVGSGWCFATNQWDYLGSTDSANSFTVGKKIDLYGWVGQSASYNSYGLCSYDTWNNSYYGTSGGDVLKTDWGCIPEVIANCGMGWLTLSDSWFSYILNSRLTGKTVNGTNNARYTEATIRTDVSGVNGLILFPDDFSLATPSGVSWGTINAPSSWSTKCTAAGWSALEGAGCVFLPAAGCREGAAANLFSDVGYYWTSSVEDVNKSKLIFFDEYSVETEVDYFRSSGYAVRLVKRVN